MTKVIFTFALVVIEFLLGLIVYLHSPKARTNRLFTFLTTSIIIWTGSNFFADYYSSYFWTVVTYVGATFIFYSLYLFTLNFPDKITSNKAVTASVTLLTVVLTAIIIFFSKSVVAGITPYPGGVQVQPGPLLILLGVYFVLLFLISTYCLLKKFMLAKDLARLQLEYITLGLFVGLIIGLLLNLILPLLTGNYVYTQYGPLGVIFFLVLTLFAIVRYNLLNITVIATEVFVFLMVMVSFSQLFIAESKLRLPLGVLIFVSTLALSFFLIRTMLREYKAKQEIERLSRRLADFISFANHDLKTYITGFGGYTSMLADGSYGKFTPEVQDIIEQLYGQSRQMLMLVETFLDLSKVETGRLELARQPYKLDEIIDRAVKSMKFIATKNGLTLEYQKPAKPLPQVYVDPYKLPDVIMNILSNAIKYTKKGGIKVWIEERGEGLVTLVKDTGIGMSPADIADLFQKYKRLGTASRKVAEGTGIGMFIAKAIIDKHGGKLWAESEGEGKGSTFLFSVPTYKGQNDEAEATKN